MTRTKSLDFISTPRNISRVLRTLLIATVLSITSATQPTPPSFAKGKLIRRVVTQSNPSQSYALYLPLSYDPSREWPVIFVFEPAARGPIPVSLMKDAAEKFGYVIVASNNSRNGPLAPQMEAANAMWIDAHTRLSVDSRRTYFAGFSGGARLAVMFTAACKCAAGVVASGAAFPANLEPKSAPRFLYFGSVGYEDFNFPEYLQLEPKLKDAKFTYHLRRFDGAHEWPPADVWSEAFEWFNLQAMKTATIPKNDAFIAEAYARALSNAAAQKNDLDRYRAYSQAASDFAGIADISAAQKFASDLQNSKSVKDLSRRDQQAADDQHRMSAPISTQLEALKNPDQRASATLELRRLFDELQKKTKDDKDPRQIVAKRVRAQEFIHAYEDGMQLIADKEYGNALLIYDVIINNAASAPGSHLQKARIHLLMGDQAKALLEARLAVKDGVDDPDAFSGSEFDRLKSVPEFRALLDSLHPNKTE